MIKEKITSQKVDTQIQKDFIRERLAKNFKLEALSCSGLKKSREPEVIVKDQITKRIETLPTLNKMLLQSSLAIQKEKKAQGKEKGTWTGKIGDDFISFTNLRMFPYEVLEIKEMRILHRINEHAELTLTAIIEEKVKEDYVHQTGELSPMGVFYLAEEKPVVLFYGIVTEIRTDCEGEVHFLHLKASDLSLIMDLEQKSRMFQNTKMTSHQLIQSVMKDYTGSAVSISIPNEPIGKLVIQYKETDWEFLCRFLSRYYQGIFTKMDANQISFAAGVCKQEGKLKKSVKNYKISKDLMEYQKKQALGVTEIMETDFVGYELTRAEILRLGEYIELEGQKFYVQKAEYGILEQVVKGTYLLRPIHGLKREPLFNERIIGVSIQGVIAGVSRDRVKVKTQIDGKENPEYWFPYATVAASPDGGGWYCMPEVGEEVRVYCPQKEESSAYAASAIGGVSPESSGGAGKENRMSDPKNKSLKTAQGQEIKFTPAGVLVESNGGESSIQLNMDGSVTVSGQKAVYVTCVENLSFRAEEEIKITAQESIDFLCEAEGSMKMEGEVTIAAKNIKNNCE